MNSHTCPLLEPDDKDFSVTVNLIGILYRNFDEEVGIGDETTPSRTELDTSLQDKHCIAEIVLGNLKPHWSVTLGPSRLRT